MVSGCKYRTQQTMGNNNGGFSTAVDNLQSNQFFTNANVWTTDAWMRLEWFLTWKQLHQFKQSFWWRKENIPGIGHFDHPQLTPWEHVTAVFFFHFQGPQTHQLHSTESYFCYLCILYIAAGGRVSLNYGLFTAGEYKLASSAFYSSSRQCLTCKLQSAGSFVSVLAG